MKSVFDKSVNYNHQFINSVVSNHQLYCELLVIPCEPLIIRLHVSTTCEHLN